MLDVRLWGVYIGSSGLVISTWTSACYSGQKAGQVFKDDIPATVPFISHLHLPPRLHLLSPTNVSPGPPGTRQATGEDKLQPQSLGYHPCFHLHQQLISHHWRALACQAEDFIRDVLYGRLMRRMSSLSILFAAHRPTAHNLEGFLSLCSMISASICLIHGEKSSCFVLISLQMQLGLICFVYSGLRTVVCRWRVTELSNLLR